MGAWERGSGRRGESSGRIPNQSVLAPDWPGSRAAERRGTTRAPCTRTPQRIAHCPLRCPKRNKAKRARREKGASALPALRYCLWAGCRVRHFPSPVLFSSLFSLSLQARVFLALCCPCPLRCRAAQSVAWSVRVYAARAVKRPQHSTAHLPGCGRALPVAAIWRTLCFRQRALRVYLALFYCARPPDWRTPLSCARAPLFCCFPSWL